MHGFLCWVVIGLVLTLVSGCASYERQDRIKTADDIAARHGFSRAVIHAGRFDVLTFAGQIGRSDVLRVYIEGDGFSWVTRTQPSMDPTPIDPLALRLATLDRHPAAYMARPCQFVRSVPDSCETRYWTSARFSPEIVDSMNIALDHLKRSTGVRHLVLVGYSGGGAIASLLAARRDDVAHLVTVAGNLDHRAWATLHGVTPLTESRNPTDVATRLASVPQTHFIGGTDRNIPLSVFESFRSALPRGANVKGRIVPSADHRCCWADEWPGLQSEF